MTCLTGPVSALVVDNRGPCLSNTVVFSLYTRSIRLLGPLLEQVTPSVFSRNRSSVRFGELGPHLTPASALRAVATPGWTPDCWTFQQLEILLGAGAMEEEFACHCRYLRFFFCFFFFLPDGAHLGVLGHQTGGQQEVGTASLAPGIHETLLY